MPSQRLFNPGKLRHLLLASASLLLAAILLCLYFLLQIKTQLDDQLGNASTITAPVPSQHENRTGTSTETLTTPIVATLPTTATDTAAPETSAHNLSDSANNDINYLEDIAWIFNQQGALSFQQHTIDTSTVLRLHELLHRLASRGFNGTAAITIYVGDFCSTKDNNGIDQLAPESSNLSNCMLSSELYGMERLLGDYQRETEMILRNLTGSINSTIKTDIHALPGMHPYPERLPTFFAGEWNSVAQKNNRIELVLVENN